jgi:DNA-binding transcriptional MerR regulator
MSGEESLGEGQYFRIGAVSRLTGVPADTLRVWERRYGVVIPTRSPAGTRLYCAEDVGRLGLIKQLVDKGDAISSVARLSIEQLRERVRGSALRMADRAPARACKLVVGGSGLAERLSPVLRAIDGIELTGTFGTIEQLAADAAHVKPDVVIVEYPTVHPDQVREISVLLARTGAARTVLVYGFAAAATVERLEAHRIILMRAPLAASELRRLCLSPALTGMERRQIPGDAPALDLGEPLPPRRFDQEALVRIATASSTVRCECPHHLVDLISSLAAFEDYSEECEIRSRDDAALHAYLHAASARARSLIETALARVIEAEGIRLDEN